KLLCAPYKEFVARRCISCHSSQGTNFTAGTGKLVGEPGRGSRGFGFGENQAFSAFSVCISAAPAALDRPPRGFSGHVARPTRSIPLSASCHWSLTLPLVRQKCSLNVDCHSVAAFLLKAE